MNLFPSYENNPKVPSPHPTKTLVLEIDLIEVTPWEATGTIVERVLDFIYIAIKSPEVDPAKR